MGIHIGTAGWTIPRLNTGEFPSEGSSLERYAARFTVAEINSSFHRPHRPSTWERWRDSVPAAFRFSVKIPKTITHQAKLRDCANLVDEFLSEARALGKKFAVLLVQLPPKLDFDAEVAGPFFRHLRTQFNAGIACEPRNLGWFSKEADALLGDYQVARVAADPAICGAAAIPGGCPALHYWRLHGSPIRYRSSYSDRIEHFAGLLTGYAADAAETWCIFDNTASSAATRDALALAEVLPHERR